MLIVNGKPLELNPIPSTVEELIEHLGLGDRRVMVEKNAEILDPEQHSTEQLTNGDRIEIVHFVGGG